MTRVSLAPLPLPMRAMTLTPEGGLDHDTEFFRCGTTSPLTVETILQSSRCGLSVRSLPWLKQALLGVTGFRSHPRDAQPSSGHRCTGCQFVRVFQEWQRPTLWKHFCRLWRIALTLRCDSLQSPRLLLAKALLTAHP